MSKSSLAKARRNLGLGFALPIIGGAVAIIFGLILRDLNIVLTSWIWVIIFAILGGSVVLGTFFAGSAFRFGQESDKRVGATRGALNLNFILGIIWSSVLAITSFVSTIQVASWLRQIKTVKHVIGHTNGKPNYWYESVYSVKPISANWIFNQFLPLAAMIALAVVGTYLLIVERTREPKKQVEQ